LTVSGVGLSLLWLSSWAGIPADGAINALPRLVVGRDEAVAIGLSNTHLGLPRPPGNNGPVDFGGAQPCFPAPIDQRAVVGATHHSPLCSRPGCSLPFTQP